MVEGLIQGPTTNVEESQGFQVCNYLQVPNLYIKLVLDWYFPLHACKYLGISMVKNAWADELGVLLQWLYMVVTSYVYPNGTPIVPGKFQVNITDSLPIINAK